MAPHGPWLSLADLEAFDPQAPRGGRERRFLCPLCGAAKARDAAHRSLSLNEAMGLWRCHRCGAAGRLRERWTPRRPGQASVWAVPGPRRAPTPAAEEEPPFDWEEHERQGRFQRLGGTPGEEYLARRGIPRGIAAAAEVVFCPDWYGEPAVVFPLWDERRELVAGHGRYLDARAQPRMRSSRGASGALFETAGGWEAPLLIVCEAPIDALSLAVCGFPAVALQGTCCPDWLPRHRAGGRVVLAHDADAAGDQAAAALGAALRSLGGQPERLRPAGAKDWNELLLAHGSDALREALTARLLPRGPVAAAPLSEPEAHAILVEAFREIGRTVPGGAVTWAERNRPDLLATADQAETRLVAAYEGRESSALSDAAEAFIDAYQAVAAAFVTQGGAVEPPDLQPTPLQE